MASSTVTDIKRPFADVYKALDPKAHRKAMRSAMRREGGRLRKMAVAALRDRKLGQGTNADISKGIRARVFPDRYGAGFMLTAKPHGKRGYHRNRFGREKPVLMWAEDGTKQRSKRGRLKFLVFRKKGRSTGRMGRYGFMARAEALAGDSVERNLFGEFQDSLDRAARKQGLL